MPRCLLSFITLLALTACGGGGSGPNDGGGSGGDPVTAARCGDGICNGGEWCASCPGDCGSCEGNCNVGERQFVDTQVLVDQTEFIAFFDGAVMFPFPELGPWQHPIETGLLTTFGTGFSFTCLLPQSLFDEPGNPLTTANCALTTAGLMWDTPAAVLNDPSSELYKLHWRRNYTGITSQLPLVVDGEEGLLSIVQIEHTNYINFFTGEFFQDVLNPENSASGDCDAVEEGEDCDPLYKTFVAAVWTPFDSASGELPGREATIELGPVVWPDTGYHDADDRVINGFGSGTALVRDGYVYLYFTGGSRDDYGLRVARVEIDQALEPTAYEVYDGAGWGRSLPEGFTKEAMADFMDVPGGAMATRVSGVDEGRAIHTMVARATTGGYVAVEESVGADRWQLRLRYAEDGLAFGDPFFVAAQASSFTEGSLNYPLLATPEHRSDAIDPASFFIVGSSHEASPFGISRMALQCR